jgi:HSP20 family protein
MWDPFGDLAALRREMARMLETVAGVMKESGEPGDVDVDETEDGWTVTARLPGVAAEEVSVDVDGRDLRIRAPGAAAEPAAGTRPASIDYRLTLPDEVDPDRVDATMDHGLLTIRLPRSTRTRRRTITVQRPE